MTKTLLVLEGGLTTHMSPGLLAALYEILSNKVECPSGPNMIKLTSSYINSCPTICPESLESEMLFSQVGKSNRNAQHGNGQSMIEYTRLLPISPEVVGGSADEDRSHARSTGDTIHD